MGRDLFQYVISELDAVSGAIEPLSGARVTVELSDGEATQIYQAFTGSTQGPRPESGASGGPNPFITGNSGAIEFYANGPEAYRVTIEDTIAPARFSTQQFIWTSFNLDDNSLPGAKIIDSSITTAKIQDGSINAAKINSTLKPSSGATAGTEALRALGTGSSQAAAGNDSRLTNTRTPSDNTVSTVKVQDGAITNPKIADSSVDINKIAVNAVDASRIVDASVTAAELATNSVTNPKLATDAVTLSKIADNAITLGKVALGHGLAYNTSNNGGSGIQCPANTTVTLLDVTFTAKTTRALLIAVGYFRDIRGGVGFFVFGVGVVQQNTYSTNSWNAGGGFGGFSMTVREATGLTPGSSYTARARMNVANEPVTAQANGDVTVLVFDLAD